MSDAPVNSDWMPMPDRFPDSETDLIQRYFGALAQGAPGAFGLHDDAGLLKAPADHEIVLTTDVIVEGVHYHENARPEDVGYKALGVNISDLCAKGAKPAVYLLSLAINKSCTHAWLDGVSQGLASAQKDFSCVLLGGDTVRTPGPAVLSVTAAGFVPEGKMVHRHGASEGDKVYVTGTIGDAALGLLWLKERAKAKLSKKHTEYLLGRYWRPRPPVDAVTAISRYASAAMDISDGLVGDFAKLCAVSGVGGRLEVSKLPLSGAATIWLDQANDGLVEVLTGGDDYEVLLTVPEKSVRDFQAACEVAKTDCTEIGQILDSTEGVTVLDQNGQTMELSNQSYDHFH